VRVWRGTELVTEGKISRMQSGKNETDKAKSGQEVGLSFDGKAFIEEGDIIEAFREDSHKRTLEDQ